MKGHANLGGRGDLKRMFLPIVKWKCGISAGFYKVILRIRMVHAICGEKNNNLQMVIKNVDFHFGSNIYPGNRGFGRKVNDLERTSVVKNKQTNRRMKRPRAIHPLIIM